jgi:hypothetical protein
VEGELGDMEGGVVVINYNDCDTEGWWGWYCLGDTEGAWIERGGYEGMRQRL